MKGYVEINKNIIKNIQNKIQLFFYAITNGFYIKKNKKKAYVNYKKTQKIKVLFLMHYPEMWNSEKTVYQEMLADKRFEVSILASPKNSKQNKKYKENLALEYCINNNLEAINAYENGKFIKLRDCNADYIFLQYPYIDTLPREYSFFKMFRNSLICYIPYCSLITKGSHLYNEFNKLFLSSFYIAFVNEQVRFDYINNWIQKYKKKNHKRVFITGFPRNELIKKRIILNNEKKHIKNILYLPRWTSSTEKGVQLKGHFKEYIKPLLCFFEENKDLNLIIRPHPQMFSYYIQKGIMSEKEVDNIKKKISESGNVKFDDNIDYLDTFDECDLLLADSGSLLLEFYYTKKPVIYCGGEVPNITEECKKMLSTFYACETPEEAMQLIYKIQQNDWKKEERQNLASNFKDNEKSAGNEIKELLIKDLCKI